MCPSVTPARGQASVRMLKLLLLLWLAGAAMRVTILAIPPLLPLIHDELHLSETQVGLLIGLPLIMFAAAAIPGSLLISRLGASLTLVLGMALTAAGAAGRAGAPDVWLLYAATMLMGFGIAIMQPALPSLVREWMPDRIGFGTAVGTNGVLVGVTLAPTLTIPVILPLVGHSWRLGLLIWALPVVVTAILFVMLTPPSHWRSGSRRAIGARWWPDWRSPVTWLLGLTFGSNNSIYFATNAFLPDYLTGLGRADLIGPALGWLNSAQLIASFVLILFAEQAHRRTWPYLIFGPMTLLALLGVLFMPGAWMVAAAGLVGFCTSITFVVTMALPPVLAAAHDVHRISAGMFTVSYTCAVIIPTLSGALWDLTGRPWAAFVPLCICAVMLACFGTVLSLQAPHPDSP